MRRTVLTGWVLMIDERKSFIRLLVSLLVSIGVFVLTLIKKPYLHYEDQFVAVGAQLLLSPLGLYDTRTGGWYLSERTRRSLAGGRTWHCAAAPARTLGHLRCRPAPLAARLHALPTKRLGGIAGHRRAFDFFSHARTQPCR